MFGRAVATLFGRELRLLQFRIRLHSSIAIAVREVKHAVIERVETGQGNELEFIAHRPQFTLKLCNASAIEFFPPIEGRRTIISQQLSGKLGVNSLGELFCFIQIWLRSLAPD